MQRLPDFFASVGGNGPRLWRLVYLTVAGALFFMGIEQRFDLPLTPILDPDSPNYLWPALLKLNGEGFVHNAGLNFLYPGWLYLLLRAFSDFRAIAVAQHLLGVAGGIFFLLGWNRLHALDAGSALRKAWHDVIGLFGVAIYLLSPIPVVFELSIRPEALCLSLQLLSFWLIVQFVFHQASSNERKTLVYAIAAVASVFLLFSLKPSYALSALFVVVFVSWLILHGAQSWKSRALFFAGVVGTALVLFVPEGLLARGDRASRLFLPQTLFSVHANLIRAQMEEDVARGARVPFPRPWLQTACEDLGAEMSRPPVSNPSPFYRLGFNPDLLMNGEQAIFNRWLQQLGNDDAYEKFLTYYYWRALRHRPLSFAAKIARQLGVFYRWNCPAFSTYQRSPLVFWHYEQSAAVIKDAANWKQIGKTGAGVRLLAETEKLLPREIEYDSGRRVSSYQTVLRRAYLPVLLASVLLALWILLFRKLPWREKAPSLLVVLLFALNFGNVLGISAVHSMEVLRYSTVQFAAALVAELWAIRYLLEFVLRRFKRTTSAL